MESVAIFTEFPYNRLDGSMEFSLIIFKETFKIFEFHYIFFLEFDFTTLL